jgi:hypothetical protein
MPRECASSEHDLDYSSKDVGTSDSIADIRCRRCGIRMTVTLRSAGQTVRPDIQIYPASGSSTISHDMVYYFLTTLGLTLGEMKADGYQVVETDPTVHARIVGF